MQRQNGQEAYLQCSTPFLRGHSPYALDFYTAVLVFAFYKDWTPEEIKSELDKHLSPLLYTGPRVKTIKRWLDLFKQDASEHTSFFVRQLLEHKLKVPNKPSIEKRFKIPDYPSRYFLECICSLYVQLHPKTKNDFRFLWYANRLLRSCSGRELFQGRPP